jgi:hypothetical protein
MGMSFVQSEKCFLGQVRDLARLLGYACYHTFHSKHSEPGFPDLVLGRPPNHDCRGRLVFAELKTDSGKLTPEQERWLWLLEKCGAECYLWTPSAWDDIVKTLT